MRIGVRRVLKIALLALAALLLVIQVFRPARTNPPFDPARTMQARTHLPPKVGAILDRACLDCHSNQTRWPWYSQVAPVSWFVTHHVKEGRRHLNFSQWAEKTKIQDHDLFEICEQVKKGEMPISSYTWVHHGSVLAPGEAETICEWTKEEQERLASASSAPSATSPVASPGAASPDASSSGPERSASGSGGATGH